MKNVVRLKKKKRIPLLKGKVIYLGPQKKLANHVVVSCFCNDSFKCLQDLIGYRYPDRCSRQTT